MTLDDLERDWRSLYLEDDIGDRVYLKIAFDECLGRLGKAGTLFADYLYFCKDTGRGRRITLLKVGPDDACVTLTGAGPGGFQEETVGRLCYCKPDGSRRP